MNVVIPKTLQKQVQKRAQKRGISETKYIRDVITNALAIDEELDEEMRLWEQASIHDFNVFAKKHKL